MDAYSLLYSSAQRTGLLSGFQRLRSQQKMCDVVLEAGGVTFPCHRALLASSSDYFWALFGDTTAERLAVSISLPALTPEGLDAVLDFLYSGWLSVSARSLPVVLAAARYLQVEPAVSICERFIMDDLSAESCCGYANLAEQHALPAALQAANQTIGMEMATLLHQHRDELLGLNVQSLMAVLDADEMPRVKEAELVKMALDWLTENGPIPLLKSNLLLSRLRFGLVASSELAGLSHAHRAMATPLIRGQLTRALEYHRLGPAQPIRQSRQSTLRTSASRVLLVGGGSRAERPETQLLTFDPRSRKFSSLSSRLPLRLRSHCVCSVGGFLFLMGGEEVTEDEEDGKKSVTVVTSNQAWRFDPRFARWERLAPMLERRAQFCCCVLDDVIYAIGGRHTRPDGSAPASVASVEFYDMAAGAWRRGASMPRPVYGHAGAVLDGCVYVSGGVVGEHGNILGNNTHNQDGRSQSSRDFLSWDGKARAWERRASMTIGRFGHRLASARGLVYALLGMFEPFCDIERYDPRSDHWLRLQPLRHGSFSYGLASTPSGNLLVFGGRRWQEGQEVAVRSVLEYDTRRDRWREVSQLPRALSGAEATLLPLPD